MAKTGRRRGAPRKDPALLARDFHVSVSPRTYAALDGRADRSKYIERLIMRDLGLPSDEEEEGGRLHDPLSYQELRWRLQADETLEIQGLSLRFDHKDGPGFVISGGHALYQTNELSDSLAALVTMVGTIIPRNVVSVGEDPL